MTQQKLITRTPQQFQKFLLNWYATNKRVLPWRQTQDPYAILVSEVMLQQTQVDRVIPKYMAWLQAFPTIQQLAKAPLADILRLWSGLGYNSRALRLQKTAQHLASRPATHPFPLTPQEWEELPGIGPYTARSVLIFAYNQNLVTIDTNIRRILLHEFELPEAATSKELYDFAETLLPPGKSRDWHNALMDYGAIIITARKTKIKPIGRQSKFIGSKRWYRGNLIKLLVHGKQPTCAWLAKTWGKEKEWVKSLVTELAHEGFITKKGNKILITKK